MEEIPVEDAVMEVVVAALTVDSCFFDGLCRSVGAHDPLTSVEGCS